jgi:hypothetical protein
VLLNGLQLVRIQDERGAFNWTAIVSSALAEGENLVFGQWFPLT